MDGRAQGATLIEQLTVLGILSLAAVLGYPGLGTSLLATESHQFQVVVMRSLAYAKRKAVGTGERITLCASQDDHHCERIWEGDVKLLVFSDKNRNYQLDGDDVLHHSQALSLSQGRGYWRGSLGRPYMRFRTDGSAVEYGRYSYCPLSGDSRHFRQLVVNRVGRPYPHHNGGGRVSDCR